MKQEFIKFLKSKRLWGKFEREFKKDRSDYDKHGGIVGFLEDTDAKMYVDGAFIWDDILFDTWYNAHTQWQEHLEKLKEDEV